MLAASDLAAAPTKPRRVRTVIAGTLAAAIALDIGSRGGPANVFVTITVITVVGVLLIDGGVRTTGARALLLLAGVPAAMLTIRASPWLAKTNVAACAALIIGALLYGRDSSIFNTTLGRWAHRFGTALLAAFGGWKMLGPSMAVVHARSTGRLARMTKAALVATPFVGLAVVLLASSDAVFSALVTPDADIGTGIGHLLLVALFVTILFGAAAAARVDITDKERIGTFGALEAATMLGFATAVLLLFVSAQVIATSNAGDRLVRESGLTPAQYARTGFFQLCFATLVILILLALVRRLTDPGAMRQRGMRALATAAPVLTIGLVVVSLRRMALYDHAFGLTMLRLWVVAAAVWMGLVLVMMAIRNLIGAGRGRWIGGVALLLAVALTIVADVGNAEAFVVRHNLARARHHHTVDQDYLSTLSDDGVVALDSALHGQRRSLREALDCDQAPRGVATLNVAVHEAERIRATVCPR